MSCTKNDGNKLQDDDWAFVDKEGTLLPKEKLKTSRGKNKKQERKKKARPRKEVEADFEVIKDGGLTTSTIIATTELPPFVKETRDVKEDWGIVEDPPTSSPGPNLAPTQSANTRVDAKPNLADVEFVQIPEHHGVESLSDTSSTCSFDVIDENKRKILLDSEIEKNLPEDDDDDDDDGCDDGGGDDNEMPEMEFRFDFPTVVALFCLTTVLGFVIGHGVGIATSLLVVKTPMLKTTPEITPDTANKPQSDENTQQNQDSELEGKIQKWKSLYRDQRELLEENQDTGVKVSGHLPGLKEAHKQLSLENYKLKKAYSDIQKQLDLMKVMSWYRRAQVDKLRQNDKWNMTYVVGILRKELQYLEAVYLREKRLADMWRNEEKEKKGNLPDTWKEFKERWNRIYRDGHEGVCMGRRDCEGETRVREDTSGSNKKTLDETSDTQTESNEALDIEIQESTEAKGDFGTVEEKSSNEKIEQQRREAWEHLEKLREDYPAENLFWRHLRLAKAAQDENMEDYKEKKNDQIKLSTEEIATGDNTMQTNDQNGLSEGTSNNEDGSENNKSNETNNKESDTTDDSGKTSSGFLTQQQPDWFAYEVLERDEDIVIAFENKDIIDHVVYGFLNSEFRQIDMNPENVLVMSMKTECFDLNSGFVVSVINNSPKPVHFFALLPNGKIKGQKIAEQVRVTIVDMGSGKRKPLTYEAIVLENGKLEISKQNDGESVEENGESGEENGENRDENNDLKNEDDENKVENNGHENVERQDDGGKTPRTNQEVPLSSLTPGESHFFNQCTKNIYRRTVSAHQYPISEYENLLAQIRQKQEKVYYRFQGNMIAEKFIVKDEVVKMNDDGSISIGGDDEGPAEDTTGNREPVQYKQEVATIVEELLKNTWVEGKRVSIMMTYDSNTGTVTTIDVTLFKVHSDDVISHDVLKNGKIEKIDETTKITSYFLHENKLLRIVREDLLTRGFTKITPIEETDGDLVDNTNNENYSSSENEDENNSNSENKDENFRNSENEDEKFRNSDNGNDEYSNSENEDELKLNSDDLFEDDKQTLEGDGEESQSEECTLNLGEEGLNEYWAYTVDRGAIFIQETVERVMPTPKHIQEDFGKLNMTTNNVEESVSYVYCKDGSVQKTWRRIEKVSRNKARQEEVENKRGVQRQVADGEELQEDWTEEDVYENEHDNRDDLDDFDHDYEHDDIGDDVGGNNDDLENKHHDDDIHEDDIDEDDYDEDDYDGNEYDGFDHEYVDDYMDDTNNDIDDDIDDDVDDDISHNNDDNNDDNDEKGTPEHIPQDHKQESNKLQPNPEQENINKKPNYPNIEKNSNDSDSIRNEERRKDLEKINYELFISREWQNLKLRQQQFEHSKKKHLRLQQQMQEEWSKMKQQYREFQENFQRSQKSDLDIEGIQFDNLKKQIEDELKKSLKDEWDKLKKKQEEIEIREKVLDEEDESVVRYQDVVGHQRTIVDQENDIDEHLGTERGLNYADINTNEQRDVTSQEQNTNSDGEAKWEVVNDFQKMEEIEMDSYYEDISSGTPESTDELVIAPWLIQSIRRNPTLDNDESYVDRMEDKAWEMNDSDMETPTMEENLPHELPYIAETGENLSEDYHVDKMLSEAWEMSDTISDEEQDIVQNNPPQERSHIPSTYASEYVEQLANTQFARNAYEPSGNTFQIDASENPPLNEKIPYMESATNGDNIQPNEPSPDTSDNGLPKFEAEDTASSSQWELQIQKLREEIDKLYKARTAQISRNELQVVKQDIELPVKPTVKSIPKSENVVQPKCPPKCPKTPSDSTKDVTTTQINPSTPHKPEKKSKLHQKKSDQKIHQPLSPKKSDQKQKETSFSKEFHDKTKQPERPKKLDKKTKHPSERETEEKRNSYALTDFIEGHSYLRQLEQEEYDEKMPGLKNGPLVPGKKAKKNKTKLKEKSKEKSKSSEQAKKKRKQEKSLKKKAEENGWERLSKRRQKEERKIRNNVPLIPPNEKKNTKKSKREKSTRKTQ